MKSRWLKFWGFALLGLVLLSCGLLVPAHLRAVDSRVLSQAGKGTPALSEQGMVLVRQQHLGPAAFIAETARRYQLPGYQELGTALTNLAAQQPGLRSWGVPVPALAALTAIKGTDWTVSRKLTNLTQSLPQASIVELVVRRENRDHVLKYLETSPNVWVRDLLNSRALTRTELLPPSKSSSGQVFDAAVAVTGLLVNGGLLNTEFRRELSLFASEANRGAGSQRLEEVYLDLLSLGQRCSWGQFSALIANVDSPDTLHRLAGLVRKSEHQLPVIFAAIQLSGKPRAVTDYLWKFGQTGSQDLGGSMRYGAGGVNELLARGQRLVEPVAGPLFTSVPEAPGFASFAYHFPQFALISKWGLYLGAGFLLALAVHFGLRPASLLERPLQVRGFHLLREGLFALGFLLVVLLLSEPFLAQESQKVELPFRLRLPGVATAAAGASTVIKSSIMNQLSLLTLLLFFVLQGLIYVACLVKLAEIRRQNIPPRIKLKLLENEDHLFDAGLYLGFAAPSFR